jgi:hypothetical protein
MNIDSNGISMKTNEAVDIVNCNLTVSNVLPRSGSALLGDSGPTILLAGDDRVNGEWVSTGIVGGFDTYVLGLGVDQATMNHLAGDWRIIVDEVILYDVTSGLTEAPLTGWAAVGGATTPAPATAPSTMTPQYGQPDEPVLEYFQYYSPSGGTILFAFCSNKIFRYVIGSGYETAWNPGGSPSLTQWSITNCIDRRLGATVVAAGSIFKRPGEIYTAGSDRVLLYFDIDTLQFVTFVCKTNRLAEHEYSEVISSNSKNVQVWDDPADLPTVPIVSGSAYLVAGNTGVIATAGLQIIEGVPIDISQSSPYKWTVSPADGDEYHLEIDAGGDPLLSIPTRITEDLVDMVFNGTLGSLVAGEWGFGDNDTLGYETIYIRRYTDTDPAVAGDFSSFYSTNNRWLPVAPSVIAFGEDSFINLETGTVSVSWLTNNHHGEILFIFYSYELAVDYRPLYISNYQNALVFANTSEVLSGVFEYLPWRVRWSEQGNIQLFKEDYFQELALDDISPIIGMRSLETEASSQIVGPLYFMKRNSIIRGTYNQNFNLNPDLPVPMFSFEIALSEGMEATRTITNIQGTIFFLGRNDVYMFNGVNRVSLTQDPQTGSTRVQKYIFDRIDLDVPNRTFAVYDEINRRYMLFIKTKSDDVYATLCMVYDIDLQHWSRYVYQETSAALNMDLADEGIIDDLVGDIQGLPGTIDSLSGSTRKINILAQLNETYSETAVGGLDRTPVHNDEFDSYFVTRDFFGETLEEQDRTERVYVEGKRDAMTIGISGDYDTAPAEFDQVDPLTFGAKYSREVYNPDITAIHARFIVTLTGSAEFRWMQVFSNRQEMTNE